MFSLADDAAHAAVSAVRGPVSVVQSRVEDYQAPAGFDTVITRAFAAVADVVAATGRLCAPQGQLLLMKGAYPITELEALPPSYTLHEAIRLQVPGLDAERHVLVIRPCV